MGQNEDIVECEAKELNEYPRQFFPKIRKSDDFSELFHIVFLQSFDLIFSKKPVNLFLFFY